MSRTPVPSWLLLVGLVLLSCSTGGPVTEARHADEATRRMTASGEVVGFAGPHQSHAWLGLPFAAPPLGELRWREPRPPAAWGGTREALAFGSPCPQIVSPFGGSKEVPAGQVMGSEDCLYLNVYAPRFAPGRVPAGAERRPVLVWIHGGGNTIGHAGFYDGSRLAASQDVIVVTINYRLGPFGWFRHAALKEAASAADASGNYGTLDLIRALGWVRENVAAFGGDPGNVTVFGESAGGRNVVSLLVAPRAGGLFHRAIVQSGSTRMHDPREAEALRDAVPPGDANSSGEALLRMVVASGEATDRAAARAWVEARSPVQLAAFLRGRTTAQVMDAYADRGLGMLRMPLVFADGEVLPAEAPLERFAAGRYNRVPVLLGTNRDENKLFMFSDPQRVRYWFWLFPRLRDPEGYAVDAEYQSKLWKVNGVDDVARALQGPSRPAVFAYRFDWDEEPQLLGSDLSEMLGAAHGFEIPFVFGHYDLGPRGNVIFTEENLPGREELAGRMMSYWAQFARSGDPGRGRGGDLPRWTAWDPREGGDKMVLLDTDADGGVRMSTESITKAGLFAQIEADPRLADVETRCALYADLVRWGRLEPAELTGPAGGACDGAIATAAE